MVRPVLLGRRTEQVILATAGAGLAGTTRARGGRRSFNGLLPSTLKLGLRAWSARVGTAGGRPIILGPTFSGPVAKVLPGGVCIVRTAMELAPLETWWWVLNLDHILLGFGTMSH